VCVDESLMMWKGNLSWKVSVHSEHAGLVIKSFELREVCASKCGRNFLSL
jgi:hypothetical protein